MRTPSVLALGLSLLTLYCFPATSAALTVQIAGSTVGEDLTGSGGVYTVLLSGADGGPLPYGNGCFTIAALSTTVNPPVARVVATDAGQDSLKLENALIKAITASPTIPCTTDIVAFHGYTPLPSGPTRYLRDIQSEVIRNDATPSAPPGAYVKATGWVESNEIYAYDQRTIPCSTPHPTCGDFKYPRYEDNTFTGNGEFTLLLNFKFKAGNDKWKISVARVYTTSVGGGGAGVPNLPGASIGHSEDEQKGCVMCCQECPKKEKGNEKKGKGNK